MVSFLPGNWLNRFRAQRLTYDTTNDAMVAWLVWKGQSNRVYNYVPSYILEDDHGQRVMRAGYSIWSRPDNQTQIEGRELILPRHGRKFRLYLYHLDENSHPVCTAEFNLLRAANTSMSEWNPEPLPVRKTNDGVEFTLTSFRSDNRIRPERGFSTPLVEFTVAVRENGHLTTNWQMTELQATDAIGNNKFYGIASYSNSNSEEKWSGSPPLWLDETWRLKLDFKRRDQSDTSASNEVRSVDFVVKPQIVSTNG